VVEPVADFASGEQIELMVGRLPMVQRTVRTSVRRTGLCLQSWHPTSECEGEEVRPFARGGPPQATSRLIPLKWTVHRADALTGVPRIPL